MSSFRMVKSTVCSSKFDILGAILKKMIIFGFLMHSRIYMFDDISGPNQAIGLKFAPNSPVILPLLGFRQALSHSAAKNMEKIRKNRHGVGLVTPQRRIFLRISPELIKLQTWNFVQIKAYLTLVLKVAMDQNNDLLAKMRKVIVFRAHSTVIFENQISFRKNFSLSM